MFIHIWKKPRFFKFVFMVSFICLFTIQGNAASQRWCILDLDELSTTYEAAIKSHNKYTHLLYWWHINYFLTKAIFWVIISYKLKSMHVCLDGLGLFPNGNPRSQISEFTYFLCFLLINSYRKIITFYVIEK